MQSQNNNGVIFISKGQKAEFEMNKRSLIKDLNDILDIIEDSRYSYSIWLILVSRDVRSKYLNIMLRYGNFFQPTATAHITAFIVNLYKLFDPHNRALSIDKILKNANEISRSRIDNKKIRKLKNNANKIWKKIKILRNSHFAHKEYNRTEGEIYKLAELRPNEIEQLIDIGIEICYEIGAAIDAETRIIDELCDRDTYKLLDALNDRLIKKHI